MTKNLDDMVAHEIGRLAIANMQLQIQIEQLQNEITELRKQLDKTKENKECLGKQE